MKNDLDRVHDLTRYSHARLGLGHTGGHLRTANWLDFQAGFAQAKDAVTSSFDNEIIANLCMQLQLPNFLIHSKANDLYSFLANPMLGRQVATADAEILRELCAEHPEYCQQDILIVISGGLSPLAVSQQIPPFLPGFIEVCREEQWSVAPIIINPRGRVALGDHLNDILQARLTIMLIGERPGLSSPNSLGIYLTQNARPGCTDNLRQCISNIHAQGLLPDQARVNARRVIRELL